MALAEIPRRRSRFDRRFDRIRALNRETDIASLRNDARLASGVRQKELLDAAGAMEAGTDQVAIARERGGPHLGGCAGARTAAEWARAAAGEATQRRGQDLGASTAAGQQRGARDIAELQSRTQRDVAGLNSDSRVAAAEARAGTPKFTPVNLPDQLAPDGITVLKGGQVLLDNQTGAFVRPTAGGDKGQTGGTPPTPKAEYDKLPKGAKYVGPDGKTYVKA